MIALRPYLLSGLSDGIQGSLGTLLEGFVLKDTGRSVPENGLGIQDNLGEDLIRLVTAVETQPAVRDTGLVGGIAGLGGGREAVGSDIVDGQVKLDVLLLGSVHQFLDNVGTILVEE